jgi:hypothetical protein
LSNYIVSFAPRGAKSGCPKNNILPGTKWEIGYGKPYSCLSRGIEIKWESVVEEWKVYVKNLECNFEGKI